MIYNRLEELMEYENINITELSEKTKISRNTLSSLINKNEDLTAYKTKTIETLCSYFGISIEAFLTFVDDTFKITDLFSFVKDDKIYNNDNSISQKGTYDLTFSNYFDRTFTKNFEVTLTYLNFISSEKVFTSFENKHNLEKIPLVKLQVESQKYTLFDNSSTTGVLASDLFENKDFVLKKVIPVIWGDFKTVNDQLFDIKQVVIDVSFITKNFSYLEKNEQFNSYLYFDSLTKEAFLMDNI